MTTSAKVSQAAVSEIVRVLVGIAAISAALVLAFGLILVFVALLTPPWWED